MRGRHESLLWIFLWILLAPSFGIATARAATPAPITLYLPIHSHDAPADRELIQLIERYNRDAPGTHPVVEVQRKGSEFSSLRETVSAQIAGIAPDLAQIEPSEIPTLETAKIGVKIPESLGGSHGQLTLPFSRTDLRLVVDQEFLFRMHEPLPFRPRSWSDVLKWADRASKFLKQRKPQDPPRVLEVPVDGPRGLWMMESLVQLPLWTRESGGIRANPKLEKPLSEIRAWMETERGSSSVRTDLNWDRALQDFIERKTPAAVLSSDLLSFLDERAEFRWQSVAISELSLPTGSDWIVVHDRPEVWKFLEFWKKNKKGESTHPPADSLGEYSQPSLLDRGASHSRKRTSDRDVLRIRSFWIQALPLFFGDPSVRKPISQLLNGIDRQVNSVSSGSGSSP